MKCNWEGNEGAIASRVSSREKMARWQNALEGIDFRRDYSDPAGCVMVGVAIAPALRFDFGDLPSGGATNLAMAFKDPGAALVAIAVRFGSDEGLYLSGGEEPAFGRGFLKVAVLVQRGRGGEMGSDRAKQLNKEMGVSRSLDSLHVRVER